MNKKRLLGLLLLSCMTISGMFFITGLLLTPSNGQDIRNTGYKSSPTEEEIFDQAGSNLDKIENHTSDTSLEDDYSIIEEASQDRRWADVLEQEPWPPLGTEETSLAGELFLEEAQLIYDSSKVDYMAYIPKMKYDEEILTAIDISCPNINIDAQAAILFDVSTKEVLYCKNPVQAVFPASTAKLLTSMVALTWCSEEEEVRVGDEVKMIAPDSTHANLKKGQRLTIKNLLEGLLLPSGNDAAYVIATYVGRKVMNNPKARKEQAVATFVLLMNQRAKKIGLKNSSFKTPDGYDALGQYTTAYDMGLIGMEALKYDTIVNIAGKSKSRNIFLSGEDITWSNTNKLIARYSGKYYEPALGLKTGTSTMAGKCLVSAGEKEGRIVVSVIMGSSSSGRWDDTIKLLKYGLERCRGIEDGD